MNPFKPIILLSILALGTLYSQEESLTADQVWTKVLEKYSSCKSFECTFVESEDNGKEGIGGFKKDKTGMLRFQAPDLLRIDWMDSMAGQMTSSSSFVREGKKYF